MIEPNKNENGNMLCYGVKCKRKNEFYMFYNIMKLYRTPNLAKAAAGQEDEIVEFELKPTGQVKDAY